MPQRASKQPAMAERSSRTEPSSLNQAPSVEESWAHFVGLLDSRDLDWGERAVEGGC